MTGHFITFEGGEGSGKTTQIRLLQQALAARNIPCVSTREPGGTPSAGAIRELLLTGEQDRWHPISETLLFLAARIEHIERIIKPALAREETVICDRFMDSTIVYQGIAKELGADYIRKLHQITLATFVPDMTFLLDIDPQEGLKRAAARAGNEARFEGMDLSFHQIVRKGFLDLAKKEPMRFIVIDASKPPQQVHAMIDDAFRKRFH